MIPRSLVRRAAWLWLLLVLVGAAVNVPWALSFKKSRTTIAQVPTVHMTGPEAARPWPSRTPHDTAWPPPDHRSEGRLFAIRTYDVRARPTEAGRNGFAMSVQHLGWPLPALEKKQMWWDWNDPQLQGPESDPAMGVLPLGLIVNPLVLGTAAWFMLVLPLFGFTIAQRAWRHRGRCCMECGYPIGVDAVCTECGRPVTHNIATADRSTAAAGQH